MIATENTSPLYIRKKWQEVHIQSEESLFFAVQSQDGNYLRPG